MINLLVLLSTLAFAPDLRPLLGHQLIASTHHHTHRAPVALQLSARSDADNWQRVTVAEPAAGLATPVLVEDAADVQLAIIYAVISAMVVSTAAVGPAAAASGTAVAAATGVMPTQAIFEKAAKRALGGGISGFAAGIAQVVLLMWLRTTMNYQYRNGGSTREALDALYEEGGIARFYRGISFALFQTPLSRFGDTAANAGVLTLLAASDLPISVRTAFASAAAATWRIGLTPLDTMKTTLQVDLSRSSLPASSLLLSLALPYLSTLPHSAGQGR